MATQPSNYVALPGTSGGPSTQTFEGLAEGMNLAIPAQDLDDASARYLQDILLDQPGLIRRRGPITNAVENFPSTTYQASGIAYTLDPLANNRLAILNGDTSHGQLSFLTSDFTGINASTPWNGNLPTAPPNNPYYLVDTKSALNDGMWIGTSSQYDANSPTQSLALWRGGISANYGTGTITTTRGSVTVTGSGTLWASNVTPGMFLFATTDDGYTLTYVGVVQKVNSDTSITLTTVSPYPITAQAYNLQSVRGFCPRVVVGDITATTSSAIVTGANTKFLTQMGTGTYNLYRAADMAWVGKVSSLTNNTSLTLAANAAIGLNNEAYVGLRADGDWTLSTTSSPSKVGFLNAVFAECQWFANNGTAPINTNRVYFSDTSDPEDVDMSTWDGNFVDVSSTSDYNSPITGIAPAYNALLVFKENETFGIFGNTPSTFNVQKIEDDGTLAVGSVQAYGGGVLWAGRTGIFFYDGVQTTNIVAGTLGNWYKELVRTVNPRKYRMWSAMSRDHYFLFLEQANPTVPVIKGNNSTESASLCIVINMISHAPTIFTNFSIRGGVQMPFSTGLETLFLANAAGGTGTIFSSTHVFNDNGNDAFYTDPAPLGLIPYGSGSYGGKTYGGPIFTPDFYIETKKYNAGDSLILKLWSQLIVNYRCSGSPLNIDTVVGLNNIGSTSTTQLTPTVYTWDALKGTFNTWNALKFGEPTWASILISVFKPKRVRFLKRSQNFAFRIWQSDGNVNNVVLGPFQLGYKQMRPGRV